MGLDEDLRLTKRTVDIYKPFAPTVEIGDKSEKITDIAIRTNNLIEYELPKQKSETLAMAKSIATNLITNATTGYVVIRPEEILIMDTDNIGTATKVWRWNSGGLGYSNTGYNGEYGLAMTMDGQIVADYITAGTLKGCEILNGDGTFHVDENGKVTAKNITIAGGSVNIETDDENENIISLGGVNVRTFLNPAGLIIRDSRTKGMVNVNFGGFFAYNNYENTPDSRTFGISCMTGDVYARGNITSNGSITADGNITLSGAVKTTGNIEGNGIYGQHLESKENIIGKEIYADNLHFKMDNGNQYSLRTWIDNLNTRLKNLEGTT